MKTVLPSVCALDCPDACAIRITVEDGRVIKLEGDDQHAYTQGFACVKTVHYPERQQRDDRLLTPLRRVGSKGSGQFEPITWDEALDYVARGLKDVSDKYGGKSILFSDRGGPFRDLYQAFMRGVKSPLAVGTPVRAPVAPRVNPGGKTEL
jgi:anaerobic selenocysteine-containing dehydrogenase